MRTLRLPALGVIVAQLFAASPASAGSTLFTISDPRIDEASGIAVGIRSPGVLYVQNDSGDTARFFALDARSGRTRAVCAVPGASNLDWEDIATARDIRGIDSVWIADIGDNDGRRSTIAVYRVDEPTLGEAAAVTTAAPEVWRLRYPDRPHNAEALAVDSRRKLIYLATKSLSGRSEIYAVGMDSESGNSQIMKSIGSVQLGFTGTPGGPNVVGQVTVTGAAMSADGTRFVLRTYTDAYMWQVPSTLAAALSTSPVHVSLPPQPLGEGVTFSGTNLLIDSEKVGSAVYLVPVPQASSRSTPTVSPAPTAPEPTISSPARDGNSARYSAVSVAIAIAVATVAVVALVRSRRR